MLLYNIITLLQEGFVNEGIFSSKFKLGTKDSDLLAIFPFEHVLPSVSDD